MTLFQMATRKYKKSDIPMLVHPSGLPNGIGGLNNAGGADRSQTLGLICATVRIGLFL